MMKKVVYQDIGSLRFIVENGKVSKIKFHIINLQNTLPKKL